MWAVEGGATNFTPSTFCNWALFVQLGIHYPNIHFSDLSFALPFSNPNPSLSFSQQEIAQKLIFTHFWGAWAFTCAAARQKKQKSFGRKINQRKIPEQKSLGS